MRILTLAAALVTAGFFLAPPSLGAQGLAEAAAKEKERRKNLKPSKVYTDDDLRGGGRPAVDESTATTAKEGETAAPATEGDKAGAPKQKTEEEQRADQEKDWHKRLDAANAEVARLTNIVNTLQLAVNDISQNVYGSNRTNQLNRLDEAKRLLAEAQQKAETLQDEGRRSRFR